MPPQVLVALALQRMDSATTFKLGDDSDSESEEHSPKRSTRSPTRPPIRPAGRPCETTRHASPLRRRPPPSSSRKCPSNSRCCTCVADKGWTSGGCIPKDELCCGDGSCPKSPEIKCCGYFHLLHGGNLVHFQCYNATEYKCTGSGPSRRGALVALSQRPPAHETAPPMTDLDPVGYGLGPLLNCD